MGWDGWEEREGELRCGVRGERGWGDEIVAKRERERESARIHTLSLRDRKKKRRKKRRREEIEKSSSSSVLT